MTILVTGGAGFIGSNLVKYINREAPERRVRVLDDFSTGAKENLLGGKCDLVEESILNAGALSEAMKDCDAVIHLGAIPSVPRSIANPVASHAANATGTLNVLEAARKSGTPQVTVASSSSVYGANTKLPKTAKDWTRPMSPYAVSKAATEGYAIAYNYSYGMKTLAYRFFNVYGPGQAADHAYAAVVPKFLSAALKGEAVVINGDGEQSRDFTYVDTVCEALYRGAAGRIGSADPVNLAYGTNTSLIELLDLMEKLLGMEIERTFGEPRKGDVRASQADDSQIRSLFPEITPVSLEDGIRRTIDWFKE